MPDCGLLGFPDVMRNVWYWNAIRFLRRRRYPLCLFYIDGTLTLKDRSAICFSLWLVSKQWVGQKFRMQKSSAEATMSAFCRGKTSHHFEPRPRTSSAQASRGICNTLRISTDTPFILSDLLTFSIQLSQPCKSWQSSFVQEYYLGAAPWV